MSHGDVDDYYSIESHHLSDSKMSLDDPAVAMSTTSSGGSDLPLSQASALGQDKQFN